MDDQPNEEEPDRKEAMREQGCRAIQPGELTEAISEWLCRNPNGIKEILESEIERAMN